MIIWIPLSNRKITRLLWICAIPGNRKVLLIPRLFTYYDYCYMGLEKYEEFADYLMEIIKNYPSDVYSMIKVPSDDAVTSGINKVYPYLSAEKKREIDNLHVLTNTADTSE